MWKFANVVAVLYRWRLVRLARRQSVTPADLESALAPTRPRLAALMVLTGDALILVAIFLVPAIIGLFVAGALPVPLAGMAAVVQIASAALASSPLAICAPPDEYVLGAPEVLINEVSGAPLIQMILV